MKTSIRTPKILIAAGGTGGHVFPALAVALNFREKGVTVLWAGTQKGQEARVAPHHHFPFYPIRISGLKGKDLLKLLKMPFLLCVALIESMILIVKEKPQLVLGMGGYVSGPVGLAAVLLRVPLVLQEQNALPGFTNRILARFACKLLTGFPSAFPHHSNVIFTGNPVRSDIEKLGLQEKKQNAENPLKLLILGGSLGARALNQCVPAAIALLSQSVRLEIRHQVGEKDYPSVFKAYQEAGVTALVESFITDMAKAYAWADLIICRAGALTVTEIMVAGLPSILVPFPQAADDHQTHNARFLSEKGAAILMPQLALTPQRLADLIVGFYHNRMALDSLGKAARKNASLSACDNIVRHLLEVIA